MADTVANTTHFRLKVESAMASPPDSCQLAAASGNSSKTIVVNNKPEIASCGKASTAAQDFHYPQEMP